MQRWWKGTRWGESREPSGGHRVAEVKSQGIWDGDRLDSGQVWSVLLEQVCLCEGADKELGFTERWWAVILGGVPWGKFFRECCF